MSRWTFSQRWRLEGTLEALTPFHIGTGGTLNEEPAGQASLRRRAGPKPESESDAGSDGFVEVAAVTTDCHGRPYLPGTAIKGVLRSWLRARLSDPGDRRRLEKVFGVEDTNREDATGGLAEFLDAFVVDPDREPTEIDRALAHVPYRDPARRTGIVASVAIDRRTRAAVDKKLYYHEYVPPGTTFRLVITGQNLDEDDVALILFGLKPFAKRAADPIAIGSDGNDGWGRFAWEFGPEGLARLVPGDVNNWIERARGPRPLLAAYDPVGFATVDYDGLIRPRVQALGDRTRSDSRLLVKLRLEFDGPFLVNEPSRTKRKGRPETDGYPNHAPRLDSEGRPTLPSRSIRGAFRSQAERILRTLNAGALGDPNLPDNGCDAIAEAVEVPGLSLAAQVFGAPGWSAPVEFGDIRLVSGAGEHPQEFVAIDRFTGGSAEHLKFKARHANRPCYELTIGVDLRRVEPWALGLLALTLRDLIEGDITLGFGASKGYGACNATIAAVLPPGDFGRCAEWADAWGLAGARWESPTPADLEGDAVQFALQDALEQLRGRVGYRGEVARG